MTYNSPVRTNNAAFSRRGRGEIRKGARPNAVYTPERTPTDVEVAGHSFVKATKLVGFLTLPLAMVAGVFTAALGSKELTFLTLLVSLQIVTFVLGLGFDMRRRARFERIMEDAEGDVICLDSRR